MKILPLLAIFLSLQAQADQILIPPAMLDVVAFDLNGDGTFEFEPMGPGSDENPLVLLRDISLLDPQAQFLGGDFVGVEFRLFPSVNDLVESSFYEGVFISPPSIAIETGNSGIVGALAVVPETPVIANWWFHGQPGGSDSGILTAIVGDYSAYFASGGVDEIAYYTHNYGSVGWSESTGLISLSATGVPEPSSFSIAAAVIILSAVVGQRLRRRSGRLS